MKLTLLSQLTILCSAIVSSAAEPAEINVWPGKAPGETKELPAEGLQAPKAKEVKAVKRVQNVSTPTLTVFQPPAEQRNSAAVVIAPGGGYNILAWDLEGTEVAEWLNSLGVTAFVLKYRVPKREGDTANKLPLMDAQRAMSLVRSKASDYGIDPARIGMLGFSAGGNLTAATCLKFSERQYDKLDAVDDVSCRPDFGVLCYPVIAFDQPFTHKGSQNNLLGKDASAELIASMSSEKQVTDQTPPCFLWHTTEDKGVPPENSVAFYSALIAHKVPAELHIYEKGRHGVGLAKDIPGTNGWPAACMAWLKGRGIVPQ